MAGAKPTPPAAPPPPSAEVRLTQPAASTPPSVEATPTQASGFYSTVPGGQFNTAQGSYSFAAGQRAKALHNGSFVWSDSSTGVPNFFSSTANNQFLINATGGVGIGTNAPLSRLHVVTNTTNATDNTATFSAPSIGANFSHIHYGTLGSWFIRSAASTGKVVIQDIRRHGHWQVATDRLVIR